MDLPRRVVLRIILRMMRFRLVESDFVNGLPAFRTTAYGSAVVASGSEIPTAKQRLSRNVAFVYDTISGTVYKRRDVDAKPAIFIETPRDKGVDVRKIKVRGRPPRTTQATNSCR